MRVNIDWLKDWVAIDVDGGTLAEELTTAGLEVDEVAAAAPDLAGVRVAEVLSVERHPNADRLSLCRVDIGGAERSVVCGAPNVADGIKVPYAPIGTVLPDGRTIESAEIRGVASEGMLCSARELGLGDDSSGLMLLDAGAASGESLSAHLGLPDEVLEIDLTPNRGDCFSVLGIAREIAARHELPLKGPDIAPVPSASAETVAVELADPDDCPRFVGRVIRGLSTAAASPDWLEERLRRAGLRAIHPVVDVTNYVMLELGQPLHAYSLPKLAGPIRVRRAAAGERLTLLDGTDIELEDDVLAITDSSGPIGLAGIMGGASTAVDGTTTDILLESAFFQPSVIQGRARRYGLHTDASIRFERGVDPEYQERAIERATRLLIDIAGGEPGPTVVTEAHEHLPRRLPITLRTERAAAVLGYDLGTTDIGDLLGRLGMDVMPSDGLWSVTPPSHRFDITIEEDLIEEIGRMIGYDTIEPVPGSMTATPGRVSEKSVPADTVADVLVERGYAEVITYAFIDAESQASFAPGTEPASLANPLSSELGVLRGSLWPGLLRSARQNLAHQQSRCRLFEIGTQFAVDGGTVSEKSVVAGLATGSLWPEHWDLERRSVDFYDVKADIEAILALTRRKFEFRAEAYAGLNPAVATSILAEGRVVGRMGLLHPGLQRALDLKDAAVLFALDLDACSRADVPAYRSYSRYPSVRRDIAVIVDESVTAGDLTALVEEAAGESLRRVVVFDLYRGDAIGSSRKSIGIGLILQDAYRTLTDNDADGVTRTVIGRLERELGAIIRT